MDGFGFTNNGAAPALPYFLTDTVSQPAQPQNLGFGFPQPSIPNSNPMMMQIPAPAPADRPTTFAETMQNLSRASMSMDNTNTGLPNAFGMNADLGLTQPYYAPQPAHNTYPAPLQTTAQPAPIPQQNAMQYQQSFVDEKTRFVAPPQPHFALPPPPQHQQNGFRTPPPPRQSSSQTSTSLTRREGRRGTARPNSTSTIFSRSFLHEPDVDALMLSVATVLQMQMYEAQDDINNPSADIFDESKYETLNCPDRNLRRRRDVPDLADIYGLLNQIFSTGELSPECAIIALILINRFIAQTSIQLTASRWRPITITAILIAQKVWHDTSFKSAHFIILFPLFSLNQINALEKKFLQLIDYDVSVSSQMYAKYYFELRKLSEDDSQQSFKLAPLTASEAKKLEARSKQQRISRQREAENSKRRSYGGAVSSVSRYVIS